MIKKRNTILKKWLVIPIVTFSILLGTVPLLALHSDTYSTPKDAMNSVNYVYQDNKNGSMNQLYANLGESITVRTRHIITVVDSDTVAYFAIDNANASHTTLDLGALEPYVEGKKIDKEQMMADGDYAAYNALSDGLNLDNALYYKLSKQTIDTLLNGQSRKYYEVCLDYHFNTLTEEDFNKPYYYTINSYSKQPVRTERSGSSFIFNKATSDIKISQTIKGNELKIGDTVNVSLKLENSSNIYLEDAVLNIYNSKDKDTYLSNISNIEIKKDSNMRICNNPLEETVSWNGTLKQNIDQKASFHIGSWQGESELRNETEDNAIYVNFDYKVAEEDLSDNDELIIRSTLSASTPKKAFNLRSYYIDIDFETEYYFTGNPLNKVIALEDEAIDLLKIKKITEEKPDVETPDIDNPDVELPVPETPEQPDEGEVLGETINNEKNTVSKTIQTDDFNKILLYISLISISYTAIVVHVKRKKYNI